MTDAAMNGENRQAEPTAMNADNRQAEPAAVNADNRQAEPAAAEADTGAAEKKKKKNRKKLVRRIIWTVVILAIVGVGVWIGYRKLRADYQVTYDPYTATTGSISNSLSFSGTMQLVNSKNYTASGSQKVKEVYVAAGDQVKEEAKLMRLSGGETLTADFSGTVSSVDVAAGDEVNSGDSLMTLADFDHMRVSVRVGESDIASVSVGQSCRVTVSSASANYSSVIDKIDYASYTGNNVAYYTATVYVDTASTEDTTGGKVYPGMQATVTVPLEEANNVIVLKMDALSTARDNTAFVYKEAADGSMTETPVTVGVSNGNYVEIKEGISEGETVYKVAAKTEEDTGLAGLFSSLFGSQQVNRPQQMPSFGSGSGGGSNRNRDTNNTNRTNRNNNSTMPGGSR